MGPSELEQFILPYSGRYAAMCSLFKAWPQGREELTSSTTWLLCNADTYSKSRWSVDSDCHARQKWSVFTTMWSGTVRDMYTFIRKNSCTSLHALLSLFSIFQFRTFFNTIKYFQGSQLAITSVAGEFLHCSQSVNHSLSQSLEVILFEKLRNCYHLPFLSENASGVVGFSKGCCRLSCFALLSGPRCCRVNRDSSFSCQINHHWYGPSSPLNTNAREIIHISI